MTKLSSLPMLNFNLQWLYLLNVKNECDSYFSDIPDGIDCSLASGDAKVGLSVYWIDDVKTGN